VTSLDQFESAFKRADKPVFHYAPVQVARVVVLSDGDAEATAEDAEQFKRYFTGLGGTQESAPEWSSISGADYGSGPELLELLSERNPDLIITYRLLKERTRDLPYSLGTYLDHLSQATRAPLLVMPRDGRELDTSVKQVMAMTAHMTGDERIVNWAARFLPVEGGQLYLTHIEDDYVFERYMGVIGKVSSLDTETARTDILAQLLREPSDYIERCREAFAAAGCKAELFGIVKLGHRIQQYAELVREHGVDLLVLEGKDESQSAMSGVSYSLAVELRSTPVLIL
tara:strand:- start:345 stop:1199 length:855 start_codon:yes stop_codon:yes gene_type:complete